MRKIAALMLLLAFVSQAAAHAAVLRPSITSFKDAQAVCKGTLGSITFAMGHARAHAAAGVTLTEQPASISGISTMTFSNKANGKRATVTVNGHNGSVSGKNVTLKMNRTIACVNAE